MCVRVCVCIMDDDMFEVVFHHIWKFVNDGNLRYDGKSSTLSYDPDR